MEVEPAVLIEPAVEIEPVVLNESAVEIEPAVIIELNCIPQQAHFPQQ